MNIRIFLRNVWHDPVGSKVIAAVIVAAFTSVWLYFGPQLDSLSPLMRLATIASIAVLIVLVLVMVLWRFSGRKQKILVFVSSGGTCRDPMAMAIVSKLFEVHKPKHPVIIRAAGLGPITGEKASHAARSVIKEMYGEDVLTDHHPELLSTRLADEADLILVMEKDLLKPRKTAPIGWPEAYRGKAFLLKQFFGLKGDVVDPWPDGKDQATLSRYRRCAEELREILTQNFGQLAKALDV